MKINDDLLPTTIYQKHKGLIYQIVIKKDKIDEDFFKDDILRVYFSFPPAEGDDWYWTIRREEMGSNFVIDDDGRFIKATKSFMEKNSPLTSNDFLEVWSSAIEQQNFFMNCSPIEQLGMFKKLGVVE